MILSKLSWFEHLLGETLRLEAGWSIAFHYVLNGAVLNCNDSKADNQFSAWNLRVFKLLLLYS